MQLLISTLKSTLKSYLELANLLQIHAVERKKDICCDCGTKDRKCSYLWLKFTLFISAPWGGAHKFVTYLGYSQYPLGRQSMLKGYWREPDLAHYLFWIFSTMGMFARYPVQLSSTAEWPLTSQDRHLHQLLQSKPQPYWWESDSN